MREKLAKKMLVFAVLVCVMFGMSIPVLAEEGDSGIGRVTVADNPADGTLQVWLEYEDDNGNSTALSGGSCFLINEEYVLSNYHIFDLNEIQEGKTIRSAAMERLGLSELKDNDPHLKIKVYANRDMSVTATIHSSVQSQTMDYVAMRLSDKIYDRKPLALGDSSTVTQTQTVNAYGFPVDSIENKEFNTAVDVSATDGSISKLTVGGKADFFEHTAQLNRGNSGGPLVDENKAVIGVNTFTYGNKTDQKYYAVQINANKSVLDTFGISYNNAGEQTVDPGEPVEPIEPVGPSEALVTALRSEITKAKRIDTKAYTDESVKVLNDTIAEAESIANNAQATDAQVTAATADVKEAITSIEEKSGLSPLIIIGIVVLVVIVVVIILIVVFTSGKKKKKKMASASQENIPLPGVPNAKNGPIPPVQNRFVPPYQSEPEGAGETTLLDSGAGETTLLGGASSAYMIRRKNGEKITINSQNFAIGKERRRVNYCISDNTSVSRYHVVITKKGSDYYAVDQKSRNFTFINGVQLSPYQETLLTDRSTLKISDEDFEFRLS